jgi:sulfoxide reductase heme-binding subunit YedZ
MLARVWAGLAALVGAIARWRFFKPVVFVACAAPLAWVGYRFWLAFSGRDPMALGADPTKAMLHATGEDALQMLLLSLTVTPVRRIFKVNRLQTVRRMLGVWAFTYAAVHLSIYLAFDQLCYSIATCQGQAIWQDLLKRRFIFVGQAGFVMLLLLAVTSTAGWMRRLKRNWTRLHRLAYLAGVAGIVHFVWIQKSDISEPLGWAAWLAVVLGLRAYWALAGRIAARAEPATA